LNDINKLLISATFILLNQSKLPAMNKKHEKKYPIYMLIGFVLTTIGISIIIYVAFTDAPKFDWIFWAVISALIINAGLLFLGRALVHKVKSDLIRKQRQKTKTEDALTQSE